MPGKFCIFVGMNVKVVGSLVAFSLIACPLLYIFVGPALSPALLLSGVGVPFGWMDAFAEEISGAKYPEYAAYCREVPKFFPRICGKKRG